MRVKGTKSRRILAALFALTVGLTSFNRVSAFAEEAKSIKEVDLVSLEKTAIKTENNAYDVTLSVTGKTHKEDKKGKLKNTDVVFIVDTSASMKENKAWDNLKTVLGEGAQKGLVNYILDEDKDSGNTVTFVGYSGNRLKNSSPDYYISDKFSFNKASTALEEYKNYDKMSGKVVGNTGGGNIVAGFRGARKAINKLKKEEGRNQIAVLLTDGDPSIAYQSIKSYTLYADTEKAPEEDNGWEEYKGTVKCWYYKAAGNGKYIFSDNAETVAFEGLKQGRTHYTYYPKWKKTVSEKKVEVNTKDSNYAKIEESILNEADWLKKSTSNSKLYTVNLIDEKNSKSNLLKEGLFKEKNYDGTNIQTGNAVYSDIYKDLVKDESVTYQAANVKLYDKLSRNVELDNSKPIKVQVGTETVELAQKATNNNTIIYKNEKEINGLKLALNYYKDNSIFDWHITTDGKALPEGTKVSLMYSVKVIAKAPNEYKDEVEGLVKADKDTGTHSEEYAYPVSESYVTYDVSDSVKDKRADFPKAGVRPDVEKFWLKITYVDESGNGIGKDNVSRHRVKGTKYSEKPQNIAGWDCIKAVVQIGSNDSSEVTSYPITGELNEETTIKFVYAKKMETVAVYDHFNGDDGTVRDGAEIKIEQGSEIGEVSALTSKQINALGHEGEWKVVEQTDGKNYVVKSNEEGVRSVHFYYLQKAKLHITHFYSETGHNSTEERDVLFTDKLQIPVKEDKDYEVSSATIIRGKDSTEVELELNSNKTMTEEFNIDNEDIYVDIYYEYIPKDVVHTVRHIYEGSTDELLNMYTKAYKEDDDYIYTAREKSGWKLKEGTEREYKGFATLDGQKEFTFVYVRDIIKVQVKDTVKDEKDNEISSDVRYEGTRLRDEEFAPKPMLGINEKIWSITQAETRTENDTEIYEFIYTKKTKAINVFDKYGTEDAVLRTGNNVFAVDTTPEFNPETKVDWVLDKVTVNNSEAKLEDGKIKATGYDNKDIVFIYKKNETAKPEDEPKKKPEKKPEEKPETRPEPQGPSDITVPVVPTTPEPPTIETPVVNITDDTTPQGTAPTTPSAPSDENKDETETLDLEKDETPQGEIEIEEDETPQGETDIEDDDIPQGEAYIEDEATPQGIAKTAEEVQIEEDVTPKGDKTLPRTGGTSADVLNIVGLGLIGLGLVVKKRK